MSITHCITHLLSSGFKSIQVKSVLIPALDPDPESYFLPFGDSRFSKKRNRNTSNSLVQTRLPLGLKSGDAGSPLDTLALLNCCCSCRILGATGATEADPEEIPEVNPEAIPEAIPEVNPEEDARECGCEWMSTAAVTTDDCPPYPYKSPFGTTEEGAAPNLLSGLP